MGFRSSMEKHYFYQGGKLSTIVSARQENVIFRTAFEPLAERQVDRIENILLFSVNATNSIMHAMRMTVYTPYGYFDMARHAPVLGFNGQPREAVTGCDLLGAGKRAFNPVLMRFNSPDSQSPLGPGGINPYGYCKGDPINYIDPSGNVRIKYPMSSPYNGKSIFLPRISKPSGVTKMIPRRNEGIRANVEGASPNRMGLQEAPLPSDGTGAMGSEAYPKLLGYTDEQMQIALTARNATIEIRQDKGIGGFSPVVDYMSSDAVGAIAVAIYGAKQPEPSIRTLSQYSRFHLDDPKDQIAAVTRGLKREVVYAVNYYRNNIRGNNRAQRS